jgi:hypothetical protein
MRGPNHFASLCAGLVLLAGACSPAWAQAPAAAPAAGQIEFTKIVVDKTFRAEGVAVGDVNHDGKMDIIAGDVWFEAPDWKMHEIRKVKPYSFDKGYSECFANFAMDVNGDGWIDSIVVGFPGAPCYWYENPKNAEGHWKQRLVAKSACNETPQFGDLLGKGSRVPVFGCETKMVWCGVPKDLEAATWDIHDVSGPKAPGTNNFSHGLGIGDVNGDGRNDIIIKDGWWEAPEDRTESPWKFHPAKFGPDCADIIAHDINADGLIDIITSSAHDYGIWWFEQVKTEKGVEYKQHEISKLFSEAHAMILADMNGDGVKDLVTGKRWYAHNGGDPGGKEPGVLYWFEVRNPEKGKVEFIPHKIDDDSGVGTQFVVADMNGDGKLDIVTSNKKGTYVFLQKPAGVAAPAAPAAAPVAPAAAPAAAPAPACVAPVAPPISAAPANAVPQSASSADTVTIVSAAAPASAPAAVPAGFAALFDGKTFTGWEGNQKIFRIEDGAIVGGTTKEKVAHNDFLATTKQYGDFELRLKVKTVGKEANGGIQIRSQRVPDNFEVCGFQADLGQGYWGCLYDESRRNKVLARPTAEVLAKAYKPGEWNEYVIKCEGKNIRLSLNGVETVNYTETDEKIPAKGIIAVQIHGGPPTEVWYKDIVIQELPAAAAAK